MDPKTYKQTIHYINSDSELSSLLSHSVIDKQNFLVASFHDPEVATPNEQVRFLLNDASLVIIKNTTPQKIYSTVLGESSISHDNNLIFYMGGEHSGIELVCNQCANGHPDHSSWDLGGGKSINTDILPSFIKEGYQLKFFINNDQANSVFSALSNIKMLHEQNNYKFVRHIHNCVSLLVDTYRDSGFPHHFSQYFTDYELLNREESYFALLYRFYYPYPDNYLDKDRNALSDAITNMSGEEKFKEWHTWLYTDADPNVVQNYTIIVNKIAEVKEIRKTLYPELVATSAHTHGYDISKAISDSIVQNYINQEITYEDLFYTYVLKHELNIAYIFQDTHYQKTKLSPDFIWQYCLQNNCIETCIYFHEKFKENENPLYKAVKHGDIKFLDSILQTVCLSTQQDEEMKQTAINYWRSDSLKTLLEHSAQINLELNQTYSLEAIEIIRKARTTRCCITQDYKLLSTESFEEYYTNNDYKLSPSILEIFTQKNWTEEAKELLLGLKWQHNTKLTLSYSFSKTFNSNFSDFMSSAEFKLIENPLSTTLQELFRNSFDKFAAVTNLQFVEIEQNDSAAMPQILIGLNNYKHYYQEYYLLTNDDGYIKQGAIVFNEYQEKNLNGCIIMQEIGSILGLKQPENLEKYSGDHTIMSWNPNNLIGEDSTKCDLKSLDIEALHILYSN